MKKLLAALVLMVMIQGCNEGTNGVSPKATKASALDSSISFRIGKTDDGYKCKLSVHGEEVLSIPMSITIDGVEYPGTAEIKDTNSKIISKKITPTVPTVASEIKQVYVEKLISFVDSPVSLRIRVFNDGAAYRWESNIDKDVIVNSEKLTFNFTDDYKMYYPVPNGRPPFSHQESRYEYSKISETKGKKLSCVPFLVELDGGKKLLFSDVNVSEYPGMWVKGTGEASLDTYLPGYPKEYHLHSDRSLKVKKREDFIAKTNGKRAYPWRAFVVTDDASLLTSTMLYSLADECKIKDTSWIKPGKVSWDWWNAWNLTDVPFAAGINQETYKNYIDFASKNGLEYIILDEGWSVKGPKNLLVVIPTLDIAELVEYGKERNVGVILWMTSVALETNFEKAFKQFDEWGIKGLKVDFMQRDDQVMMDFCEKVAKTAAEHKLIVDFHGGSKPTGLQRTYPNVLTHESVLGLENSKWSKNANPDTSVLIPFIRGVVGPMDYTPGAMDNYTNEKFVKDFRNPSSLGTRCHQLAMYVAFISPLQMLCDTPSKYRKNPKCMEFLQAVPTTWDETVVLDAKMGSHLAIARRNGDKWFIGALTDWNGRELGLKLDFLGKDKYTMKYWADGPRADTVATNTSMGRSFIAAGATLKIKLAAGGGFAAVLEPVK